MDIVDQATRSRMMSGIRGKDTKPELAVRRGLHALGFRYRLHQRKMPGNPDIVLPRYGAVVFVHGCFWHGHDCRHFKQPMTRQEFWRTKIGRNRENDQKHLAALLETGWRVGPVWECAIRMDPAVAVQRLSEWLLSDDELCEVRS
jgi:DNA mismatch endonuclease (patch repair protein)